MKKILALLEEFQAGYIARDKMAVNGFVKKLFVPGDSAFVLGTGSGELFTGEEKVRIGLEGDHGWFVVEGRVSRSFEDSTARCDRYLSFVAEKIKDEHKRIMADQAGTSLPPRFLAPGGEGRFAAMIPIYFW